MIEGPCHGCTDRYVGCHSKCLKYIDYRQKLDTENLRIKEQKKGYIENANYVRESKRRMQKIKNPWRRS